MKKYRLPWYLCLAYCLLGISLPLFVSIFAIRNRLDVSQPIQDIFIKLSEKDSVNQIFTAKHDNINIIILDLKNPGLNDKGDYSFSLQTEEGRPLVERAFSGYNVGDPSIVRFQFDPIAASKNKNFRLSLKSLTPNGALSVGASREEELNYFIYYSNLDKKTVALDLWRRFSGIFRSDLVFFGFWFFLLLVLAYIKLITTRKIE